MRRLALLVIALVAIAEDTSAQTRSSRAGRSDPQELPEPETYRAVLEGMNCKQKEMPSSPTSAAELDCEYRVGKSLYFAIPGVGQEDAAATFYKVDWDGDYYASVGGLHGCVVVKPGKAREHAVTKGGWDLAFVSLKNGKVYREWPDCARASSAHR